MHLLLVSHDRAFLITLYKADALKGEGKSKEYVGGYQDGFARCKIPNGIDVSTNDEPTKRKAKLEAKGKKPRQRLKRKIS